MQTLHFLNRLEFFDVDKLSVRLVSLVLPVNCRTVDNFLPKKWEEQLATMT